MAIMYGSKGAYTVPDPVAPPAPAPSPAPKTATAPAPAPALSPTKVTNQPTTAGGYVVPNIQTQPTTNYLQQSTNTVASAPAAGGNAAKNQTLLNSLGFTGTVGSGAGDAWLQQHPDQIVNYTIQRQQWDPSYKPNIDLDPNTPGTQTFNRTINSAIGNQLGYSGTIGRGEMGSGQIGVDYLSSNPAAQQQYQQIRDLFDPSYRYQPVNVAPEGWDAQQYLSMNPQVQAQIDSGQYISPLQQYLLQGKQQGLQFNNPYNDFLKQLQDVYNQQNTAMTSQVPASLDAGANLHQVNRPDRMALPSALSYMNDMSDLQRRSAIATDAVYGAGADKENQDYYMNTLLQDVMDNNGGISNFDLNPVEKQYLSMLGMIPNNSSDFLTSLQRAYGYGTI